MTTAISASNIKFPTPTTPMLPLTTPTPVSPVATGLTGFARTQPQRQALVCFDLLDETFQFHARQEAEGLFPQMLDNTGIMMGYGKDAVKQLNALADKLLKETDDVDIPELEELMDGLSKEMRRIKTKWDVSDPEVAEKIRKWAEGGISFFFKTKTLLEMLMEDVMSIEQRLDKVVKELGTKHFQLLKNVGFLDQIYKTNEQEVLNLVYRIAVMEQVVEVANAANLAIKANPLDPADRNKVERKRLIAELAANMDIRVGEFKNRLFVGWATSPQTTNLRSLDVGMAAKIDLLINLTIPTMKLTISQWRMLIQTMQAADMERVVAETANEWMLAYAQAGAEGVQMIAESVETPTLRPDTVSAMAELVASQADSILEARTNGRAMRREVSEAIFTGYQLMADSQVRLAESVVDAVIQKAVDLKKKVEAANPEIGVVTAPAA